LSGGGSMRELRETKTMLWAGGGNGPESVWEAEMR
jgi:hypothetical protein